MEALIFKMRSGRAGCRENGSSSRAPLFFQSLPPLATLLSAVPGLLRRPSAPLWRHCLWQRWRLDDFLLSLAGPYFKQFNHLQVNCLIGFQNDHYRSNAAQTLSFPKLWKSISAARVVKHLMNFSSDETCPFNLNLALKRVWPIQISSNPLGYNGYLCHASKIHHR